MAVFTITQLLSLFDGVPLPTSHSPLTRSGSNDLDLREGHTAEINLQEILNSLSGVTLANWDDLDLDSDASITVQVGYQLASESFGTDHLLTTTDVVVSTNTSLNSTELTADTTGVLTDGLIDVTLASGSIAEHIPSDHASTRFFVKVTINDGY